ncbi:sensor histidine kinase [Caproiciproducens sp. MSJ-32]|uniref:sensor histidine kinase n=1 Tax=Caproiciproducens sp. MSJ-32 TaxID=2841527 RepID=UPI00257102BB|nr:HAMP domain-containing sensor histidine kinase [Caproiciproducens sp. MSJ-32]
MKKYSNSYKKLGISSIIILLITILSVIIFNNYNKIYNLSKANNTSNNNYEYIQDTLYRSNFVLYKMLKEKEEGKPISYGSLYNEILESKYQNGNLLREGALRRAENKLKNLKNLDYFIINKASKFSITNTDKKLEDFIKNVDNKDLKDYYRYYIVIDFSLEGKSSVLNTNNYSYNQDYYYNNNDKLINEVFRIDKNIKIDNPKDVTIVYGIPKVLVYEHDIIAYEDNKFEYDKIAGILIFYMFIAFAVIALIALFIPYKKSLEDLIIGKVINIPFEILIILLSFEAASIALAPEILYRTLNNSQIIEGFAGLGVSENIVKSAISIFNIFYWLILFLAVFVGVTLIKYIFGKGFIKYIKENTLIGRITRFLIKKSREGLDNFASIDFKEEGNKYILKLVGINFIIVTICCLLWVAGIFAAIVYSIVLFFILRKYLFELKDKYSILLNATNKIAEGNLDIEITEDLKIFEAFKEELLKIQRGFKKAVDEEVKSQKMKTDLITNVSHDLKTPLTSIITYIDLLKDENSSEENKKQYIDIINKKAQRLKILIEDLFEMSKVSSNNISLNIMDIDIIQLIKQAEIELQDRINEVGLTVKWNISDDKIVVPLDSQKTFRVFDNLFNNIIKYSMRNSRVYVDINNKDEEVEIILKNISAVEMDFTEEEIVERFQRGDKSRSTEGSGLGLAIAKSFVEAQGGSFKIDLDGDLFKVIIRFKHKPRTFITI